ncbi:MAG: universal stress protein [Sphingobacteriaceae bacterium]
MKNFSVVFDGYKISDCTLQYAVQLSKASKAHLTGIFLDVAYQFRHNLLNTLKKEHYNDEIITFLDEHDRQQKDSAILKFRTACEEAQVTYVIKKDENLPLQELRSESMFADLMFISENQTLSDKPNDVPSTFVKELLADVQCPVMVLPLQFSPIQKLVFLYDGSSASLYAIKMFSYLFENFSDIPVSVFSVNENESEHLYLPNNLLMKHFINSRFSNSTYTVTNGIPKSEILQFFEKNNENVIVVLGAYQRNAVSRMFKRSLADDLIINFAMPLFIAHH